MSIQMLTEVTTPVRAGLTILGAELSAGDAVFRIVEVEAYGGEQDGPWPDPAAHSYRGRTARNQVMFGRAGLLYVYRSYGMHLCMNISYAPEGVAGGVLLRAAEVKTGGDVVAARRPGILDRDQWARGPGNFGKSAAISLADNGTDVFDPASRIRLTLGRIDNWLSGPRVGVSSAAEWPWRLWLPESAAVSAYRRSPRAPAG